jgi:cytochrome c-type protein NapC
VFIGGSLAIALCAVQVRALDWAATTPAEIALFFPGQMSWEKALTASAHKGAPKIRAGESCAECHADETVEVGASQAEAVRYAGRSAMTVQVRAAIEGGEIHWQISGPLAGGAPSVAIMLGTDAIKTTALAGCWGACHDDAPGMASDTGQKLGKYLARSRLKSTATGGGADVRPAADLEAALAAGEFFELIEVESSGKVERGHVLDRLHEKAVDGAGSMRVEGDRWIAEVKRPLAAAKPGEIALSAGAVYHYGVAVRDPGAKKHQHLVSLAHRFSVGGGSADLVVSDAH